MILYLMAIAFHAGWEKFIRLVILLIVTTAAVGGLAVLLGPYATTALGLSTLASRTRARRTRRQGNARP
ncbi:hypothetical protein EV192_10122 [Actinocrispum wychmicini]|uniref:Uncharacterized protein n=2 Tax=Actinocrispum wychmicini TaxID=1213861 RepID=A0A4R2K3B4_9PSEU|nr:hypothetical protein EV192_10122 [Actinocrispum wychmicini]